MKIKVNKKQLEGVVLLLTELLNDNVPAKGDIPKMFVYEAVVPAFNKMRIKAESLIAPRSGYGISLTDQEARALWIFLQNVFIPESRYQYEMIQLNQVISEIDQHYG